MTLSKRGDYVMRSAICLARAFSRGEGRKIREVVEETEIPASFASQILADLVRAGLATSKAGRDGGYRLVRDPAQVSVLEVVEAAEGTLRAERCALGDGPCRWDAVCPLHETWSQATALLRDLLARTTLAELAERDRAIEEGTYAVPSDAHRSHPQAAKVTDAVHVELAEGELHAALSRLGARVGELLAAAAEAPDAPVGRAVGSLVPAAPARGPAEARSRYLLGWELEAGGVESRFEADLFVDALDDERCELRVEGTWHHRSGPAPSGAELERSARRTLRAFLRGVARDAEEGAPVARAGS